MSSFTTEEKKYDGVDINIENVQEVQDLYTPIEAPNSRWAQIRHKVTTRDGWIGDYDYVALWYGNKNNTVSLTHINANLVS